MTIDGAKAAVWPGAARSVGVLGLLGCAIAAHACAADTKAEEQAIRAAASEYFQALSQGDGKKLAACWTSDGRLIDAAGNEHPASELADEAARAGGDGPQPEVRATSSTIHFVTDDVAVENGSSEIVWPGAESPPVRGRFQATWVKQDGRWRLASLCEMAAEDAAGELGGLDAMVGNWSAERDGIRLEATVKWNAAGTALLRETKAVGDDGVLWQTFQITDQDPATGQIRSWTFDAGGGHAEGVWSREGNAWVEQASGTLPDGRRTSATATITFDGRDQFTRKLTSARIDGQPAPDEELVFRRMAADND